MVLEGQTSAEQYTEKSHFYATDNLLGPFQKFCLDKSLIQASEFCLPQTDSKASCAYKLAKFQNFLSPIWFNSDLNKQGQNIGYSWNLITYVVGM